MTLELTRQKDNPGDFVQLFELDMTKLGGVVLRFVMAGDQADGVRWRGETYAPVQIEAEGFEMNGQGSLPTPKIRIANVNGMLTGLIRDYKDLIGARLTRTRTFRQHLDDGEEADPTACWAPDVYQVERNSVLNKIYVEWELSAVLDQQGTMLPARQVLRDYCDKTYRRWTGAGFDYSTATCPYSGAACFDAEGASAASAGDRCGKRLSDCKRRFGATAELPYGGFPGVARVRARG
jgi:lambda family phage minor tail protein L